MSRFGQRQDDEQAALARLQPVIELLAKHVNVPVQVALRDDGKVMQLDGQQIYWVQNEQNQWQYSGGRFVCTYPGSRFEPPDWDFEEAWTAYTPPDAAAKALGTLVRYRVEQELDRQGDAALAEEFLRGDP